MVVLPCYNLGVFYSFRSGVMERLVRCSKTSMLLMPWRQSRDCSRLVGLRVTMGSGVFWHLFRI